MEQKTGMVQWVKDHLWHIGAALSLAYSGYATGQATINQNIAAIKNSNAALELRVSQMEKREAARNQELQRKMRGRFLFMNDVASTLNYMCQQDAVCSARYPVVRVPE